MSSPIQDKTVRPSSFVNYSYYHAARSNNSANAPIKTKHKRHLKRWFCLLIVVAIAVFALSYHSHSASPASSTSKLTNKRPNLSRSVVAPKKSTTAAATTVTNPCSTNTVAKRVLVSISAQHLYACQDSTELYNSPVITGIAAHPDTITPTGTFDIYGKYTDTTLTGCDSTGCWNDPVSYWMPFLHNQYGSYGLHDATWRTANDFGNISPSSSDGSQGCVELPLATAAWLYNWVEIGTPVTIQN